ncbi:MAG TPA: DUF169 domain-containing protein [Acidimicrobiales bacterium]|nr:DUF169 domain-containing protein [Acidimicrobiales bacterium]
MTATTEDRHASDWAGLAERLAGTLHLAVPPIAITFSAERPVDVAAFDAPMSPPAADGRAGRVPAGCVFWVRAADTTFSTVAEDHGNCSVGSVTHGFAALTDVAGNGDVAELLASGWVSPEAVGSIPAVSERPGAVTYGPLASTPASVSPDVVLVRVNGRQMMVLSDALPGLRIEGKPQCHIVALAKEQRVPAASVGCALSRARTGMTSEEMTCALPAAELATIVEAVERAASIDTTVAKYAASDARRFEPA